MASIHKLVDDIRPLSKLLEEDVTTILNRFFKERAGRQPTFELFKEIWLDMNLHLIYCGRDIYELFLLQDILLDTVKKRLCPPFPTMVKVGAVYLLVILIELIPYKRHLQQVKLRLTLNDVLEIKKLMRDLVLLEYDDAAIMLTYILSKAHFVAHPMSDLKATFLKKQTMFKADVKSLACEGINDLVSSTNTLESFIPKQLDTFGLLENMKQTCAKYYSMKQNLSEDLSSRVFDLVGPDIVNNLCGVITDAEVTEPTKDIGKSREEIKRKSFKQFLSLKRKFNLEDESDTKPSCSKPKNVLVHPEKSFIALRGKLFPIIHTQEKSTPDVKQRRSKWTKSRLLDKIADIITNESNKTDEESKHDLDQK